MTRIPLVGPSNRCWKIAAPRALIAALALLAVLCLANTSFAEDEDFDPVTSAGEALRADTDVPWYDAEKDDVRALPLPEKPKPPRPPSVEGTKVKKRDDTSSGGGSMPTASLGGVLQILGFGAIAVLIIVILAFLLQAVLQRAGGGRLSNLDESSHETHIDRVENLPVQVKRARSDLLGEAERQYQAGNFNEAIVYLYSYQLVQLDKQQLIRLLKGKTNRQYLWELAGHRDLVEIVEQTMVAFEDVYFGERNLSRAQFEACWQRVADFQRLVEPLAV